MIRKLYGPDLPQNERKRIAQIAVELTKRKAYRECLGVGQHSGAVEGGHVTPRSWLRKICDENDKVRVFSKLPINVFRSGLKEDDHLPLLDHLNNVLVRSFTCRNHEEMFGPTDNPEMDLSNSRILNLLVYKPIMASLWRHKLLLQQAEAQLAEVPNSEPFQMEVELLRQQVIGLEHYKQLTEGCLSPQNCLKCNGSKCKTIGHKVFHIPGIPALAVSDFSNGIRTRINPRFGSIEYIMNWGITVVPQSRFSSFHRRGRVKYSGWPVARTSARQTAARRD